MTNGESTTLIRTLIDKVAQTRTVRALQEVGQAGRSIGEDVEAGTSRASREISALERDARNLRDRVSAGGDVASNLSALSALGRLGGADIGVVQDVTDLVEQLPLLKQSLTELPSAAAAAAKAIGVGGFGLIGAIGLAGLAFAELSRRAEEARRRAEEQLDFETRLAVLRETSSVEDIEQRVADAQIRQRNALIEVETATEAFNRRIAHLPVIQQDTLRQALAENRAFSDATLEEARRQIDEQSRIASQATVEIISLNQLLKDGSFIARQAAEAETELNLAREQLADKTISAELQATLEARTLSAKAIEERLEALNAEQKAIMAVVASGKASVELSEQLTQRSRDITAIIRALTEALPGAQMRDQIEAQQDINAALIETAREYETERVNIEEATTQKLLDLQNTYADRVTDAVNKYVEDVGRATDRLRQQRADLLRDAQRDTADAERTARADRLEEQIAFNLETEKQARDLQRELLTIRENALLQEIDLIRNRDFAGLMRSRMERNQGLDAAVDTFNAEQKEREIAFRAQQQQTNRQLEFEAESRRVAFERALVDSQAQYQRELDLAAREKDKQLRQLSSVLQRETQLTQQGATQKLNLLRESVMKELQLERQGAEAKLRLQQQTNEAMLRLANELLLGVSRTAGVTNTLNSTQNFNISTGGSPAQQQGLVNLIQQVTLQTLRGFLN